MCPCMEDIHDGGLVMQEQKRLLLQSRNHVTLVAQRQLEAEDSLYQGDDHSLASMHLTMRLG